VLKSGVQRPATEIYAECVAMVRNRIGAVACLKCVAAVPQLPKTRSGKVLRVVLRNLANGKPANPPATIEDMQALEFAREALASLGYPVPTARLIHHR